MAMSVAMAVSASASLAHALGSDILLNMFWKRNNSNIIDLSNDLAISDFKECVCSPLQQQWRWRRRTYIPHSSNENSYWCFDILCMHATIIIKSRQQFEIVFVFFFLLRPSTAMQSFHLWNEQKTDILLFHYFSHIFVFLNILSFIHS